MSTETLPQALQAGVAAQFGAGTNFLIFSSAAAVNVVAVQLGSANKRIILNGCLEGFSYDGTNDGGFTLLEVTSAVDQPDFVIVVGDDKVSYPATVTVSGDVSTIDKPAETLTDTPAVVTAAGQAALFAANAARRRITIFSDPKNVANQVIYLRKTGGANNLGCITPGQSVQFDGTYGVDYDAAAAGDSLYVMEES
jgi:hypothetical protein